MGKNKKALAFILILLGILSLLLMVKAIINRNKTPENIPNESGYADPSVLPSGEDESEKVPDSSNEENSSSENTEKITFKNIESVLKYDIHPEIEALLDVEKFDKELTAFLIEKKAIVTASDDATSGIFLVTSSNYLTNDLGRDVYIFDLKLDNKERSIITVSISNDGEFVFDIN